MKEISAKKWARCACVLLAALIGGMALLTYIVDPYFHFHKPFSGVKYRLYEQRYINDGISRHFEYDAVITGNSLSENTKTTEFDELFGANSIKLPYSGAGFKELWSSLDRTLSYNQNVKKVLVFMDYDDIARSKDYVRYKEYPEYLYDENPWNDVSYLWNKEIFYHGTLFNLMMTFTGRESTTFDEYSSWQKGTGAEVVMPLVGDILTSDEITELEYTSEKESMVIENIEENVISVIDRYPEVEFYIAYCPPSIAKWCLYNNKGEVEYRIDSVETATELLLQKENVKLYSFMTDYDVVCDLNNYSDTIHYTSEINAYMLRCIAQEEKRLTKDNYKDHIDEMKDFYVGYNYQSLAIDDQNLIVK